MRFILTMALFAARLHAAEQFDVVVYGGTASGVIAAVSAARDGAKTARVNPKKHVGGMVSGGLSRTDVGRSEAIGGMAREFYRMAGNHYGTHPYGHLESWYVEPHVAEEIFESMLKHAKVAVFQNRRLKEKGGVRKKGTVIEEIEMEDGTVFRGSVFIDATYEGDLMAFAGASYIVGREPQSQYHEYSAECAPDRAPGFLLMMKIIACCLGSSPIAKARKATATAKPSPTIFACVFPTIRRIRLPIPSRRTTIPSDTKSLCGKFWP